MYYYLITFSLSIFSSFSIQQLSAGGVKMLSSSILEHELIDDNCVVVLVVVSMDMVAVTVVLVTVVDAVVDFLIRCWKLFLPIDCNPLITIRWFFYFYYLPFLIKAQKQGHC
jgi:hypothetical protein